MKVLFSPIGSTDPISNMRDGGMLHICRIHRPDKVYLYLSQEMLKYSRMDDRYRQSIKMLGEHIGHRFQVEIIEDEEMVDVQIFDKFVSKFERFIEQIKEDESVDEVIVNISSGTPAMKSALQIISMLGKGIKAIQVKTPMKSSNKYHEDKDKYDLNLQWEYNEDNTDFEDRSVESVARDMLDRIRKENIEKLIRAYDYEAAEVMLQELSRDVSEELKCALKIASARLKLDITYVNNHRKKLDIAEWFPIIDLRMMNEYEYIMAMKIKMLKGQYVDFVRDITPIFFSLGEQILKKYCDISFEQIGWEKPSEIKESRETFWCLNVQKLKEMGLSVLPNWNDNTLITSSIICNIINQKGIDADIDSIIKAIRAVEKNVRNMAAHQIVGLTADGIKRKVGYTPEEILDMCFKLADYAGIKISKQKKSIYDVMNDGLVDMLYKAN